MTYWENRAKDSIDRMDAALNTYTSEMVQAFEKAKHELNSEINAFYGKYAAENKISFAEAQKQLDFKELRHFKGNLKEYESLAKDSIGTYDLTVSNLSKKARITRLQALEMQIDTILQKLYQEQRITIEDITSRLYVEQYYKKQFDIENYTGFQFNFSAPSTSAIAKMLETPVNGADISTSLWRQDIDTGFKIRQTLNQMFTTGKPPQCFAETLQKVIGVRDNEGSLTGKKYEAYRLLYNEAAYATEQATLQAYREDGIEEYEIIATLDLKTSEICREQDGKHYSVQKAAVGVNYPPFHINCRTTTGPYIDLKNFKSTRMARDEDGNSVRVKNQSYKEWYAEKVKQFGKGKVIADEKTLKNRNADQKQYSNYKALLGKDAPDSLAKFQDLKYNNSKEYEDLKSTYGKKSRYERLVKTANELEIKGVLKTEFERMDVSDYIFDNKHTNIVRNHGTSKKDAQHFIDSAVVLFERWHGEVRIYVSAEGCSVVNTTTKMINTAYRSDEYDNRFKTILEVASDGKVSYSK